MCPSRIEFQNCAYVYLMHRQAPVNSPSLRSLAGNIIIYTLIVFKFSNRWLFFNDRKV